MNKNRSIDTLPLDGGTICFDFINTVYAWKGENLHEYLACYDDMLKWCRKVQVIKPARLGKLAAHSRKNPLEADRAMKTLKQLRITLYHIFSSIAANHAGHIPRSDLTYFNKRLADALSHEVVEVKGNELVKEWQVTKVDLLEPSWVIISSAFELMVDEDKKRIKECPACGWIFLDKTKNNKRNWCNPQSCGSIDKSRRYYQKKKLQQAK